MPLLKVCLFLAAVGAAPTDRHVVTLCTKDGDIAAVKSAAASIVEATGGEVHHVYEHVMKGFSVEASAAEAEAIKSMPEVCHVRPTVLLSVRDALNIWDGAESVVQAPESSGQVNFSSIDMWGSNRVKGLPLDAREDPDRTLTGKGTTIVVTDTGLDTKHVEFSNTDERAVANIADCVAKWRYYPPWGWNTLAEAGATVADTINNDAFAHGTHVSGTAAGKRVGVAPEANLFHIKVLDDNGKGSDDNFLCGVETLRAAMDAGHLDKKTVLSASLGGPCGVGYLSDPKIEGGLLQDPNVCRIATQSLEPRDNFFIEFAADGVAVAIAAGNDGDDACFYTPAASSSAVTVGASDSHDVMSVFSNFGACVEAVAPGSNIWSALTSKLVVEAPGVEAGAEDMYTIMSGTSQATPLVAGTIALYAEALGGEASAEDGKQAMYNAMLPRAISPSRALNGSAVESCPSNADLLQTPRLAAELDTSDFDPAAGCKLAVERLAKFQNGSEPTSTCDVGPTPEPLNAEYSFMLFNADPRVKICLMYKYANGTIEHTPVVATGESVEVATAFGDFEFSYYWLPNTDTTNDCAAGTGMGWMASVPTIPAGVPGTTIGWMEPVPGSLTDPGRDPGIDPRIPGEYIIPASNERSMFYHTAPDVGACALFLRNDKNSVGLSNMGSESDYVHYGLPVQTVPLGSCMRNGNYQGIEGLFQMVLSCTDGVETWTTTKEVCADHICPDAYYTWVASYSKADGLQLTFAQSRNCGAASCAEYGTLAPTSSTAPADTPTTKPTLEPTKSKKSDGAASIGPLAALLAAAFALVAL